MYELFESCKNFSRSSRNSQGFFTLTLLSSSPTTVSILLLTCYWTGPLQWMKSWINCTHQIPMHCSTSREATRSIFGNGNAAKRVLDDQVLVEQCSFLQEYWDLLLSVQACWEWSNTKLIHNKWFCSIMKGTWEGVESNLIPPSLSYEKCSKTDQSPFLNDCRLQRSFNCWENYFIVHFNCVWRKRSKSFRRTCQSESTGLQNARKCNQEKSLFCVELSFFAMKEYQQPIFDLESVCKIYKVLDPEPFDAVQRSSEENVVVHAVFVQFSTRNLR